jgi:outer membrane biosynthesis protein TonB
MAKQLEEALKRPAAMVAPPPAPAYEPQEQDIADEDDLLEAADVGEAPAAYEDEDDIVEPAPAPQPEPRPAVEPTRPAPSPLPPQQPATASAAASQKESDPFSVEDIEAEFARLLGRPLDPSKKG